LNAQGVIKIQNIKTINTNAARCWLFGLLFAVSGDSYRLYNNIQSIEMLRNARQKALMEDDSAKAEITTLAKYVFKPAAVSGVGQLSY
jgi:hypothetical protein